jgi:hypothetical protein
MRRPSRTAPTMVAKLSSARTMSAACLRCAPGSGLVATPGWSCWPSRWCGGNGRMAVGTATPGRTGDARPSTSRSPRRGDYSSTGGRPRARCACGGLAHRRAVPGARLFRSLRTGAVIRRDWLALHYPPYWHYDIFQALLVLSRMRLTGDPRCLDALAVLERRRRPDGRWQPGGYWWKPPGTPRGTVEVVDWGRSAPNEMITLNALRILSCGAA